MSKHRRQPKIPPPLAPAENKVRNIADAREERVGIRGAAGSQAYDYFQNMAARMGWGTPSLSEGTQYELVRFTYNYWELITLYRNHWISRRIVDMPAEDMVRSWPVLTSELDPKDLTKLDKSLRRTNTKANILTAMKWARLFGGAGCLIVIDGQENELDQPLDLEAIEIGGYKGLLPFDRWSGVSPGIEICTDVNRPLDFNEPEVYNVQIQNGGDNFQVHSSRILRFLGPEVPTPEYEAQSWWGISCLEPVYEEIRKRDNMSWNILSLSFRANILGMKFPDLAQLLSGISSGAQSNAAFESRMSAINELISNQSLVPLPKDGSIESTSYSFAGLSECYQQFQLDISGAAQIPVSRLWGKTISGLGQSNDADERIYEERIGNEQEYGLRPQLEKLYPVLCMSEIGEVPDDLDLNFPSVRVLDEKEKAELAKTTADTIAVYLNSGIFSPRTAGKEVKQSSDITGIGTNLTDEDIAKLSDDIQEPGELGEGLMGEGGGGLEAASGPAKVMKETEAAQQAPPEEAPKDKTKPPKPEKQKAADEAMPQERCGKPWKSCPECGGHIHRSDCAVPLKADKDCCKERGCQYSLLNAGKSTASYTGPATDADGEARRYLRLNGMDIVIETPKGGLRSGQDDRGKPWAVNMPADYGYLKDVKGADGDSLDVYVGPSQDAGWAYVIDQCHADTGAFDEHKVMLGYESASDALAAYRQGHHRASEVFMDWTPMQISDFKQWTHNGTDQPAGNYNRKQVHDEENFKESDHKRDKDGKFATTGGSSAPKPLPKGMENYTKSGHKTVASYVYSVLNNPHGAKFSNQQIAQAAQSQFGGKTSPASIAWYKMKQKQATPAGKEAMQKKMLGIQQNNSAIKQATAKPMEPAKLDAALDKAEKAGYKTVFVKASVNGKMKYLTVSNIPPGIDSQVSMQKYLEAKKPGMAVMSVIPYDKSKPAAPDVEQLTMSDGEGVMAKAASYKAAEAISESKKPYTELDEPLSPAMQKAIKHYTNGLYADLNRNLRNGTPMSETQAQLAAELDKVMNKSKTSKDITVRRNVGAPHKFFGPTPTIGTVILDNGFISTSKNPGWGGSGGHVAEISIPKGSRAVDVQALSHYPTEAEVVLPRGSMFKIVGISGKTIKLEYING